MGKGRPIKLTNVMLRKMRRCYIHKMNDDEVAEVLEISVSLLREWRTKYPRLMEGVTNWRRYASDEIELTLYERAVGYSVIETKLATHEGQFTDEQEVITHYPPDVRAMQFWLQNMQPKRWRDRHTLELELPKPMIIEKFGSKDQEVLTYSEPEKVNDYVDLQDFSQEITLEELNADSRRTGKLLSE